MSTLQTHRRPEGGRIQRDRTIAFRFDGARYTGHPGDTLASALVANGVRVVGRSLKYHRPRGVFTAGPEEPNALVQLTGADDEPNVRATTLALRDGLQVRSLNRWPSLKFDIGSVNNVLSPLFPAGFYYKTLMGGLGWNVYGPVIRRMAGLGRSPKTPPSHCYEKRFHHCDVLIAGAGVAGLAAAQAAARAGAAVLLADDQGTPGGTLLDALDDGTAMHTWVESVVEELDANPLVTRIQHATVVGYHDHNLLTVIECDPPLAWLHERLWKVRARQVVLATGAMERPLVFANNDRPGVMLLHAARAYAARYGALAGHRAVVVTNNSSAYPTAIELRQCGIDVALIADVRATPCPGLVARARDAGIEVRTGAAVLDVDGRAAVRAARVASLDSPADTRSIACDSVLVSGGWNPLVHLHSQTGARPVFDATLAAFVPGESIQAERSAGGARGVFGVGACIADGARAGRDAVTAIGLRATGSPVPAAPSDDDYRIEACWSLPSPSRHAKAFVDLQNDVVASDIALAVRESFVSVEHVKRYTTTGMGTDQGKLGNANAIGLLAGALEVEPDAVGTTTYRAPYVPVSFGAIAGNDVGQLVIPSRRTPITGWNESRGAVMFEAGAAYRRPSYYPVAGERMAQAIAREVRACRNAVGIYDGTPLGKFEIEGPDAALFLERVYTGRFADLAVSRGRFALALREDGRLLDDGVIFRLDDRLFWVFCGTGAADHLYAHLLRLLQLEWPDLQVFVTPVTTQWANICVAGPRSATLLERAGIDIALDRSSLPFMSLRDGSVADVPARIARVGYTGEMSFELNVRASRGSALWESLFETGGDLGLTPIGSEASMVMRCEKGFVSPAFEGDGTVNPYDAGLGWVVDETKPDFIGKRMLERDRNVGGVRPEVVGLLPEREDFVAPDGTALLDPRVWNGVQDIVGYVTQGCFSPTLERSIALAVVDDGHRRRGESVIISSVHGNCAASIVEPCFYDPTGARMR